MRIVLLVILALVLASPAITGVLRADLSSAAVQEHPGVLSIGLSDVAVLGAPFRWVRLEVQASLPVGSQVELWRDVDTDAPWESADQSGLIDVWGVETRDDGRVYFDLTRVLKRGTAPTALYLRVLHPETGGVDLREVELDPAIEVRR